MIRAPLTGVRGVRRARNAAPEAKLEALSRNATHAARLKALDRDAAPEAKLKTIERNATHEAELKALERKAAPGAKMEALSRNSTPEAKAMSRKRNAADDAMQKSKVRKYAKDGGAAGIFGCAAQERAEEQLCDIPEITEGGVRAVCGLGRGAAGGPAAPVPEN